eukprot:jgi/Ulvmu1/12204/UM085_0068.1
MAPRRRRAPHQLSLRTPAEKRLASLRPGSAPAGHAATPAIDTAANAAAATAVDAAASEEDVPAGLSKARHTECR